MDGLGRELHATQAPWRDVSIDACRLSPSSRLPLPTGSRAAAEQALGPVGEAQAEEDPEGGAGFAQVDLGLAVPPIDEDDRRFGEAGALLLQPPEHFLEERIASRADAGEIDPAEAGDAVAAEGTAAVPRAQAQPDAGKSIDEPAHHPPTPRPTLHTPAADIARADLDVERRSSTGFHPPQQVGQIRAVDG